MSITLRGGVFLAICSVLLLGVHAEAAAPRPLYSNIPVQRRPPPGASAPGIVLDAGTGAAPATSLEEAKSRFEARAAAAIRYTVDNRDVRLTKNGMKTGLDNEQDFGFAILAMMAYKDYFNDDVKGQALREEVFNLLRNERSGIVGTSPDNDYLGGLISLHWHGEYDVLLQSYITLYYKYFDVLPADVREKLVNELLAVSGRHRGYSEGIYAFLAIPTPLGFVVVPETENHELMIETARYLTNQLRHQQEVVNAAAAGREPNHDQFDNNRNGDDPLGDAMLRHLQYIMKSDFIEYNARPYQDYSMMALLNLASYSYDNRVRLAARMVLDYVSAKVAVSSNDLRRSTPYRRLNEDLRFGPVNGNGSLATPLTTKDPQTAFYSMLAGNTGVFGGGNLPGDFAHAMLHAGLHDYRVPDSILDIFVNRSHRRFFQRFHHSASTIGGDTGQFADELYAGSPSYLISGGGNPTYYSYVAVLPVGANQGGEPDRGLAIPSTLIPTAAADSVARNDLGNIIQFGKLGSDIDVTKNMGVAPDFVCGEFTYIPPDYTSAGAVVITKPPHWAFIDHSAAAGGYYLAIYRFTDDVEGSGFVEAYDVALHPGISFQDFVYGGHGLTGVWTQHGSNPPWVVPGENNYVTQSGQQIRYSIVGGKSDVISTSEVPPEVSRSKFLHGTILNSEQGSAIIEITNPAMGTRVTLDLHDRNTPRWTLEVGGAVSVVESAGGREEVWVDFDYTGPGTGGDFFDPFKTLGAAVSAVVEGGVIKIMPGTTHEAPEIGKRVTLEAPGGGVYLGVP